MCVGQNLTNKTTPANQPSGVVITHILPSTRTTTTTTIIKWKMVSSENDGFLSKIPDNASWPRTRSITH